jgi:hypothetical protein
VPLLEYGENQNLFSPVSLTYRQDRQQTGRIKGTGLQYGRRDEGDNGYRNGRTDEVTVLAWGRSGIKTEELHKVVGNAIQDKGETRGSKTWKE